LNHDDRIVMARRPRQVEASLITGGKSNLTYLLRSPAGELVLRRPPSGAGNMEMPEVVIVTAQLLHRRGSESK
jgi:aminoglycoside phosphotransferase (APT) family kinase protein